MRERLTARVLLLDPAQRILMMKGRLPSRPEGPSFWFPIGGGVEPGETLEGAAAREIIEETGLTDARLGPVVWRREVILEDERGEPWLFMEHYFIARTEGGQLSRAGWAPHEHALTDEVRWWTLPELRLTEEMVFPEQIAGLLPDVIAGRFGPTPVVLPFADSRLRS
jgi:ADP-ribose pyrophosphatase YjhB (NUDIX family)